MSQGMWRCNRGGDPRAAVRGLSLPTGSLAGVLMAESVVRGGSGFPPGPSRPSGLGLARELGDSGNRRRVFPAELRGPGHSNPLAGPRPRSSSEPLPHPQLCDLMVVAISMDLSACNPASV